MNGCSENESILRNTDIVGSFADSVASAVVWEAENRVRDGEALVASSCHITDGYQGETTQTENTDTDNLHPSFLPL